MTETAPSGLSRFYWRDDKGGLAVPRGGSLAAVTAAFARAGLPGRKVHLVPIGKESVGRQVAMPLLRPRVLPGLPLEPAPVIALGLGDGGVHVLGDGLVEGH